MACAKLWKLARPPGALAPHNVCTPLRSTPDERRCADRRRYYNHGRDVCGQIEHMHAAFPVTYRAVILRSRRCEVRYSSAIRNIATYCSVSAVWLAVRCQIMSSVYAQEFLDSVQGVMRELEDTRFRH